MQNLNVIIDGGKLVGNVAGTIGTVVVGDQDVRLWNTNASPTHDALYVLALVVRWDDHQDSSEIGEAVVRHGANS